MNKSSTSSLAAQTDRMAFKRQSEHLKSEVILGTGMSPWEAQVLLDVIDRIYWSDPHLRPCKEGQLRITCIASKEGPGKPLALCAKTSVVITLFDDEDERDLYSHGTNQRMAEMRQRRICRITDEAYEQGGLLTQEDLAKCLMCSVRTIRRDIGVLKRRGITLPTRGQQQDIGPTVSHRASAVEKWLEGKEPVDIARAIKHSVRAVERYLETFKRIAWLHDRKGFNVFQAAMAVSVSVSLARFCIELLDEYRDTAFLEQRINEIDLVGSAMYIAQDEKKLLASPSAFKKNWSNQ
jgi:hypothetical protein